MQFSLSYVCKCWFSDCYGQYFLLSCSTMNLYAVPKCPAIACSQFSCACFFTVVRPAFEQSALLWSKAHSWIERGGT